MAELLPKRPSNQGEVEGRGFAFAGGEELAQLGVVAV